MHLDTTSRYRFIIVKALGKKSLRGQRSWKNTEKYIKEMVYGDGSLT
jgi:hypothetical protein